MIIRIALSLAAILLVQCGQDRVAGGTGTSAGNTITARVLGSDGTVAAAAKVTVRPMGYMPDTLPGADTGAGDATAIEGLTDAAGRFTLAVKPGDYFIECAQDVPAGRYVAWAESIHVAAFEPGKDIGSLQLTESAEISGSVVLSEFGADPANQADRNIWAGFPGTEHFVRIGPDLRFTLNGFPFGNRALALVRKRADGTRQKISVHGWKAVAGDQVALAPLTLPPLASPDTAMDMSAPVAFQACPDTATSLVEVPVNTKVGRTAELMRAILGTTPPQWVELNPCDGNWRSLTLLPGDSSTQVLETFSTKTEDYMVMGGTPSSYVRIANRSSLVVKTSADLSLLRSVHYYNGKFYCYFGAETSLRIFPDTTFLQDPRAPLTLTLGSATPGFSDMVMGNGMLYCASFTSAGLRSIQSIDLTTGAAKTDALGADFETFILGMAMSSGRELWLLNQKNELMLWDPATNAIKRKIKVQAPAMVRTLTRFPN